MINILPVNDEKPHQEDLSCGCNPQIKFVNDELIIIHNAYDNREVLEKLLIICKN